MFRPYPFTIMAAVFLAGAMLVNAAESLLKADGFGCSRSPKLVYSQFFSFHLPEKAIKEPGEMFTSGLSQSNHY
jgi:hypothetical protein